MLEQIVNTKYKELNENDVYIWKYVVKHKKECEKLSIDELASRCNVSRSTILRFSKRLGLKGYAEFKVYLKMSNEQVNHKGENLTKMTTVYENYCSTLRSYNYKPIIDLIKEAKNLYIYGRGTVQTNVVNEWKRAFLFTDKIFYGITSLGETHEYVELINSNDVIVVVSFSGESNIVLDFVQKLQVKQVKVIAITASKQNRLATLANHSINIDTVTVSGPSGPFYGLAGFFLFIDCLVAAYLEEVE